MRPQYDRRVDTLLNEIKRISTALPKGKSNQIANRCDMLRLTLNKKMRHETIDNNEHATDGRHISLIDSRKFNNTTDMMNTENEQTQRQVADRYNAKKAVFEAMMNGRHISLLDSREFELSQMHTTICVIRRDIEEKNLPYTMRDRWKTFGHKGKRCKEYWLEAK